MQCAGRKADPQHTSPLLASERVLAEYSTLAEFTFGKPRYHIVFTSHRLLIKESKRFIGMLGSEAEHSVGYRCAECAFIAVCRPPSLLCVVANRLTSLRRVLSGH